MAVEARQLNLFPQQFIPNRELMNPMEINMNLYNTQMGYSLPSSGTTMETLLPTYNSLIGDSMPLKTAVKSDSSLTYNHPVQRKRTRDCITPYISYQSTTSQLPQKNCSSFSFLGEDISLYIQQHQLDVDRLISQHMEKMRMEIEEKRKRQARRIVEAIEFGVMKKLKDKEEEIEKIGRLNWALEEKVKSLYMENQIWKDLAQTNEATANVLRTNLEQVLAQTRDDRTHGLELDDETPLTTAALADDAESCCGSNDGCDGEEREVEMRMLVGGGGGATAQDKVEDEGTSKSASRRFCNHNINSNSNSNSNSGCNGHGSRLCRNCGKEESCVLILPCRHLCLCTVCGSTLHTCPICKSIKNASFHVNLS